MRRELSAGAVLVRRFHRRWWIAVTRPQGRPPDYWVLPKGLMHEGERSLETAVRETYEETGVRGTGDRLVGESRYVYIWDGERVFKIVRFFLLRAASGRIGKLPPGMEVEVAEARWLPLEEARRALAHGGEREIVAKAAAMLDL